MSSMAPKVASDAFYDEYSGHRLEDLGVILPVLRENSDSVIFLAGDSSLDNKYWFHFIQPAIGPYKDVLDPPRSKTDIAYWLNFLAEQKYSAPISRMTTINTSVEESTLNQRTFRLLAQDKFIQENITEDDILIVSVGGNDVAWAPCPCTIASILCLVYLPGWCIEQGFSCGTVPMDDYCCGCGASLLSCVCACPPCFGYFRHLFGTRVEKYVAKLVGKTKPKLILVCMIYYPDEKHTHSWASLPLSLLGYGRDPSKLQMLISKAYDDATSSIKIPGTTVVPVPMFKILDGKRTEEYCERVEPSEIGGKILAKFFLEVIGQNLKSNSKAKNTESQRSAPRSESMVGRS